MSMQHSNLVSSYKITDTPYEPGYLISSYNITDTPYEPGNLISSYTITDTLHEPGKLISSYNITDTPYEPGKQTQIPARCQREAVVVGEEEVEEMVGVMEAVFPAVEGASLPLRSTSGLMLGSTALKRNTGPASSGYFSAYEIRLRHTRVFIPTV